MTDPEERLVAALYWAIRGVPVLPLHNPRDGRCSCGRAECSSPAKHPRLEHGLIEASTDPDLIRQWWKKCPMANLGVLTGVAFDVLDVDDPGGWQSLVR